MLMHIPPDRVSSQDLMAQLGDGHSDLQDTTILNQI